MFFFSFSFYFLLYFSRSVYLLFVKQTLFFQEGSSNRHVFFKEGLSVRRTDLIIRTNTNFLRNPYIVLEHYTNFPRASIFSSNRYQFSRSLYLIEHTLFSRRSLCLQHRRTDISLIGLGGCFQLLKVPPLFAIFNQR